MRFVIAGGGTGGHLFPGMAVAEAWVEREAGNEVLFIGTQRGIEAKVLANGRFPLRMIQARPLQGKSLIGKARALWSVPMAICEAYSILRDFKPQLVLGVGGYASGPTLIAAFLLRTKRAIHEQNVIPGMTNRILKWFSQRIFVSFEETREYFPDRRTIVTGNPVRKEILQPARDDREIEEKRGDRFTLLIFGGSGGAHRINEAMIEALDLLQGLRSSVRFVHQTGREDMERVSRGYRERGFDALVRPFFEDMGTCYRISDLVICRSGATTVAELAVCGKAAILIPYPYAAHQHQLINAQKLVERGAAKMIRDEELSGPSLARSILELYEQPEKRVQMEERIRKVGRPAAAKEIVDHCYRLLGRME
ncbi:MAG: undecaprenyldiphospho-muramoylpentapeptide beta-N-acetylglucosaminyltransferase [Syntrophaceae bacterium]|nr:undecaprenyldiphospho-muramoylpentapeptide beta-N-acetylglucosaminyltransferase [Syntrophaceae bacterium]